MSTYTVFQPPLRGDQSSSDPECFVFVRDGFRFWAFVLAPLWLLWNRLWLALAGYLVVTVALQVAVQLITGSADATMLVAALVALLFGFEATSLHRWTLARRKWTEAGVVIGDDQENAERRFFERWARREPDVAAVPAPMVLLPPAPNLRPSIGPHVIGLFPEPGAPR